MSDDFKPDIWRLQARFDTQGLVEALHNADAGIRRRAAAALRALGAYQAIDELQGALDKEANPETRSSIIAALATLRQEKQYREANPNINEELERKPVLSEEMQQILGDLNHKDAQKVIAAANALGEKGDKVAVEPLVIIFNNSETSIKIRLAVAEALLKLESAPVEVALLGALRSDDWKVRRNGAAILGQLRAEWAVEPLIRTLSDANSTVRRTAYAALKYIGTPQAREALAIVKRRAQKRRTSENKIVQPEEPDNTEEQTTHPAMDETQRIMWPKRKDDRTLAPTKPLDPTVIDRYNEENNQDNSEE